METLVYVSFAVSLLLTGWHLIEEYSGKLWEYFGHVAGVRIPRLLGILAFTVGLGILLVLAALGILDVGNGSDIRWLSLVGVGFLIGGRVSDWWNSHFTLHKKFSPSQGFGKNPGFLSSWFYLADAALLIYLLWAFRGSWLTNPSWPPLAVGVLLGILFFIVVIPSLKWIRKRLPDRYLQDAWQPK